MKTIKIFGLPSHQVEDRTSGVDFARVIQPIKALNGYTWKGVTFQTEIYDINDKTDWGRVAKEFDIIFLNYIIDPWGYAMMGTMARKFNRKIVMDLDDALWYVQPDNPTAGAYKKGEANIKNLSLMLNDVDAITVTNNYLRNVVINHTNKLHKDIHILDNFIDLENIYNKKPQFKETMQICIAHHGSTTHFDDLLSEEFAKGIDRIMREYPNVTVKFIGTFIPKYRDRWGMRFSTTFGDRDIYKWAKERYPELAKDIDIMVVPLDNNIYTRCKSGIKFLENSAMGKPGVYQNMEQYRKYIKHGENGYLADSADDWYNSIKELLDDVSLRRKMGARAFETTQGQTIQKNISQYAALFMELLAK